MLAGKFRDLHLHKKGAFLCAYEWSAWLCCHYLHDFKVNRRAFKGIDESVVYIGFPESSLMKWLPEGAEQRVESEKHLVVSLPEVMVNDNPEDLLSAYSDWKDSVPMTETSSGLRKNGERKYSISGYGGSDETPLTITAIMQRVLAFPIESKSPLECMVFLADIKQRMASLV